MKSKEVKILTGAAALASITIACIALSRRAKRLNTSAPPKTLKTENIVPEVQSAAEKTKEATDSVSKEVPKKVNKNLIDDVIPYNEKEETIKNLEEKKIRDKISQAFRAFRDDGAPNEDLRYRIMEVIYTYAKPVTPDTRQITSEECRAVLNILKNGSNNPRLRAGIDLSNTEDIKNLDKLIDEACPLDEEAIVYCGIRTQKVWDNFKPLDYAQYLVSGNILKDRGYMVVSRVYDDYLAQADPVNMGKQHRDCGYILRIILPKDTKGFDCRRCSRKVSNKGANALYILPRNSSLKIRNIDNLSRIIDCVYIPPSAS